MALTTSCGGDGDENAAALRELLDNCTDTWNGVVPHGGACQTYESCAEPAVTGGASAGASCVNSICVQVVRQPAGAACAADNTRLLCDPFLATCESGTCVALPAAGEACTDDCAPGSSCSEDVCVPLLGVGEACSADSECASDNCGVGQCASALAGDFCSLP